MYFLLIWKLAFLKLYIACTQRTSGCWIDPFSHDFLSPSHKFTKWVIAMNLHSHEMPINFAQSLVFIFFLLFYFSFVCHWGQLFSFSFISNLGERRKIAENAEKKSCLAKLSDLFLFLFWHKASVDPTRTKKINGILLILMGRKKKEF